MSEYYDDRDDRPRRRSHRSTRDRSPEYVSETTYIQRGTGQPSRDLVFRGREDSIEEIDRDFPPPNAEYRRTKVKEEYPPRGSRSSRGAPRSDYYDDEYYSDYGPPAAAAAGYAAGRRAPARSRRGRSDDGYYSDDYDRPRKDRRKSTIQDAIEGLGLGSAVAALTGKSDKRSRSKSRSRRGSRGSESDRDTYRSSSQDKRKKWQQAAKAAVVTGVIEAVRSRNDPGPWAGAKGQRIATAALGAAAADGFLDRNPNEKSKRHIIESVAGGLVASRLANGSRRSDSRGRSMSRSRSRGASTGIRGRSRSLFRSLSRGGRRDRSDSRGSARSGRSQSRGRGLKEVAALGGIAAAGKAIYDRVRSKSRARGKRSPSASSEDSYVPVRRQQYQGDRGPPREDDIDDRRGRSEGGEMQRGGGERRRDESSDSVSTTDLENQRKKTRGKELLTAGLATVATIHAAHGVYSSMVASENRHKLVMEGEMSPEEARKRKSKNMLQDAAAVGIAALGLKSAFSEWKDVNEHRHSVKELEMKRRKRNKAREKRQREMGGGQNAIAYGYPVPVGGYAPGPVSYQDGNPYAVGNLPPPPMGNQPRY